MFSNKKSFYRDKVFYLTAVVFICIGIIAGFVFAPGDKEKSAELSADPGQVSGNESAVEKSTKEEVPTYTENNRDSEMTENSGARSDLSKELKQVAESQLPCYLVQYVDGNVNVYYMSDSENILFNRQTAIDYNMLNLEDQAMFEEGVVLQDKAELLNLLQDFES